MFDKETNYTKYNIVSLLKLKDSHELSELYKFALEIKKENKGNLNHKMGVIEFSNYCEKNCLYCSIRRSNESLERFRLSSSSIIKKVQIAKEKGCKGIILESGADAEFSLEKQVEMLSIIKNKFNMSITLGIGEKTEEEYDKLRQAGAERFMLTHKTSDPILYRKLHPDAKYSERVKSITQLKKLDCQVGSGIMAGLPGQTFESLANDLLLFKEMKIELISIIPYIPYPNTPLERIFQQTGGYFAPAVGHFDINQLLYQIIAIARIIAPNSNIQVLNKIHKFEFDVEKALLCGANEILYKI